MTSESDEETQELTKNADSENVIRNARENIWGCIDKEIASGIVQNNTVKSNYCVSEMSSGKALLRIVVFEDTNIDPIAYCLDSKCEEAQEAVDFLFRLSAEELDCELVDVY
jgi:hypothetical protein